jgi:hypothetical protein
VGYPECRIGRDIPVYRPNESWLTSEWPRGSAPIAEKQRRHAEASLSVLVLSVTQEAIF